MKLFDTHAHLCDTAFDSDRDVIAPQLAAELSLVMEACCKTSEAEKTVALAEKYGFIYAAIGTHPHEASEMTPADIDKLRALSQHAKVKAIGEIGLDYHYDFSPRSVQKQVLSMQLELANELKMPVILHVREATEDALDILQANRNGLSGVMHCFSGSYETAVKCLDMGLYIGFGGSLTFKNASRLAEVAVKLPMERIVIETDCPYMSPEPHRGQRNDPRRVLLVAQRLAELRGMEVQQVCEVTYANGVRLFNISE